MAKLSRIMVQGKPFLSIGGQSHNSSSYELNKMEPTWNSIRAIHGNTLATPIPWDAWEPVEGEFNKKFVALRLKTMIIKFKYMKISSNRHFP